MAGWKWEVEDGKELLWRVIRKVCVKEKLLVCKKGGFSAHAKLSDKEKLFKHTKTPTSHRTQTNVQPQISSTKTHCELEVQQPFFETSQSCVCTTVTLSHRFKAFTPAFCR